MYISHDWTRGFLKIFENAEADFFTECAFSKNPFFALGATLMVWQNDYWIKEVATHWDEIFLRQNLFNQPPQKPSKCLKHKNRHFSSILPIFDNFGGFRGSGKIFLGTKKFQLNERKLFCDEKYSLKSKLQKFEKKPWILKNNRILACSVKILYFWFHFWIPQ